MHCKIQTYTCTYYFVIKRGNGYEQRNKIFKINGGT